MHLTIPLIRDLAVILGVAATVTYLFHRIRQPVVLGYIVAGILVGPRTLPFAAVKDLPNIRVWAELGVIFLMFSLGLEFSFRKLARVGISSVLATLVEMSALFTLGFFCGKFLGWSLFDRIFLGAMISVSSTTILARALDELGLRTRKFAQVLFGILVVEDLMAILMLTLLSNFAMGEAVSGLNLTYSFLKLVLVLGGWFLIGFFIFPRVIERVGRFGSNEVLTLFSIALCLMLSVMAARFHYSMALGAFIMGSILGESSQANRIREMIKPLRDLFAAVFFVSVGMLIDLKQAWIHADAVIWISVTVIFGKSIFGIIGSLLVGQTFRTSVQVGLGLSQIGELSFVIATLALAGRGSSDFLYPVAVSVSLVTTLISPVLLKHSQAWATGLENLLPQWTRRLLVAYLAWTQELNVNASRYLPYYRLGLRWLLNGLLTSVVFMVSAEFLIEPLGEWIGNKKLSTVMGWSLASLICSPFLWAMFFGFSRLTGGAWTGVTRFLTLLWLGILSSAFFPVKYALAITATLAVLLLISFYQQLEGLYGWFENRFLSVFISKEKVSSEDWILPHHLVPWDEHLVRLKIHPDSEVSGKKVVDAAFRKRFGINIVAIQRGAKVIVAPAPEEQLFPEDNLLVLGNDEGIDSARGSVEKLPLLGIEEVALTSYELKPFGVLTSSPLVGETIRNSKMREQFGAVVVGLERKGERLVNPNPDTAFCSGDVVWVVGESERLQALFERV